MKILIDVKSAVCGLIAGVAVMFVIGAVEPPSSGPSGRFQVAAGEHGIALVDTINGRVWAFEMPDGRNYYPPKGKDNFWDAK